MNVNCGVYLPALTTYAIGKLGKWAAAPICILYWVITWFRVQFGINKHEYIFSKTNKIARPRGASAICGLWKNLQALIYPRLHEKNHVKQSARIIKCKNNSFKPCKYCAFGQNNRIRSKQQYTMIFSHL